MSIAEIYRTEPRLEALYRAIPSFMGRGHWELSWLQIKRKFSRFVGWEAEQKPLASSEAYELVYRHFLAKAEHYCPTVER